MFDENEDPEYDVYESKDIRDENDENEVELKNKKGVEVEDSMKTEDITMEKDVNEIRRELNEKYEERVYGGAKGKKGEYDEL